MADGTEFHPKIVCRLAEGYCVFWSLGLQNHSCLILEWAPEWKFGSMEVNPAIIVNNRSIWKNETQP